MSLDHALGKFIATGSPSYDPDRGRMDIFQYDMIEWKRIENGVIVCGKPGDKEGYSIDLSYWG